VYGLTEPVDTIILGRKNVDGFVSYWSDVAIKPMTHHTNLPKK
jgi:hypothetical protein